MAKRTVMTCDEILAYLDASTDFDSDNKGNLEDNLTWVEVREILMPHWIQTANKMLF